MEIQKQAYLATAVPWYYSNTSSFRRATIMVAWQPGGRATDFHPEALLNVVAHLLQSC